MPPSTAELRAIQRKLDRWELDHLRTLAADLAQRLEASEAREAELQRLLDDADNRAWFWQDRAHEIINDAQADGATVCLSMDGSLSIERAPPPTHS